MTGTSFQILVRQARRRQAMRDWLHRELKEGGRLKRYLAREKYESRARQRVASRTMQTFRQNPRSDLHLKASVPLREFLRWQAVDPDFWKDDANLRSLRRDNDDLRPCIRV